MKSLWKDIMAAVFMGMVIPGLLLNAVVWHRNRMPAHEEGKPQEKTVALPMRIQTGTGTAESRDMDEYLVGVVLAEMPASFETEALKAQSVAARTYTRKAFTTGGKHGNGAVCTDPSCCQAYLSEESYLSQGGTQEGIDKIRAAVFATSGQVLTYGGELIEATYFSCSGGSTEDAAAVWGTDYPYLRSVSSPGEEDAAYYEDRVTFTPVQFQSALGTELRGTPKSWFAVTSYTKGGGVDRMVIGGHAYSGTELRKLLGLRSTAFTVDVGETEIVITTKGYGHRVGMSQYGADAMAVMGSSYEEILAHYYPGTTLITLTQ